MSKNSSYNRTEKGYYSHTW